MTERYDAETALLVVDVQNDFASPRGGLAVPDGEAIISFTNGQIEEAEKAGAFVAYTADWHPETTPHFRKDGGIWPIHCVADTWGAQMHPELVVSGPVIHKGINGEDGYSGFSTRDPLTGLRGETELGGMLRSRGITALVIVGLATDYCVRETALDGLREGFSVTVLRDGVRAVDLSAGDGERALAAVAEAGGAVL